MRNFTDYKNLIKRMNFKKINWEFKIINQQNVTIYVPLEIPETHFSEQERLFVKQLDCYQNKAFIDGEKLWFKYLEIIKADNLDFIKKKIEIKKLYGILSQFMFCIHIHSNLLKDLFQFCDESYYEKYKILYINKSRDVYDFETGIKDDQFENDCFM